MESQRSFQESVEALAAHPPDTVLVVSDLHLGPGRDPATGRFARTENFFADDAFARFLDFHAPQPRGAALLILNGDTFDFLRIAGHPETDAEFDDWSQALKGLGCDRAPGELRHSISSKEEEFGLRTDDYKSVWKLLRMAWGHPGFFGALARWVSRGGLVLFVKGNHDLELHWPLVQAAIRDAIARHGAPPDRVSSRVLFCADSIEIGNLYVEHGHPYESVTRVVGPPTLAEAPTELNLPLGSFVNRYLVNPMERIEPFLDNIKPVQDVLWALLRRHPLKTFGILWRSWRFIQRAAQKRRFRDSLGFLLYFGALLIPVVTLGLIVVALAWPGFGDWLAQLTGRYRLLWAALGLAAPYLIGAARELLPRRRPRVGDDHFAEGVYRELGRRGDSGASVRYAVLGHTHAIDVQALPALGTSRVMYVNTGTWAPLWPRDRPDLVGRILHPFARFTKDAGGGYTHEVCQWSDGRNAPVPAVILAPATRPVRARNFSARRGR